jgi:hypothetical protein
MQERATRPWYDRPWVSLLFGVGVEIYAWSFWRAPSVVGFKSGFGFLGVLLGAIYRRGGKEPVTGFFALVGLVFLAGGVWGMVRRQSEAPDGPK